MSRRSARQPVAAAIEERQVDKGEGRRDSEVSTFGSHHRQEDRPCEKTGTRSAAEPRLAGETEARDRAGPLTFSRPMPCWAMENVDARRPDHGLRGTAPSRSGRAPFRVAVRCFRNPGAPEASAAGPSGTRPGPRDRDPQPARGWRRGSPPPEQGRDRPERPDLPCRAPQGSKR